MLPFAWMLLFLADPGAPAPNPKPAVTKPAANDEDPVKLPPRVRTGRLGELSPEEEAKYDKVIHDFIQHDIGTRPNPGTLKQLDGLSAEAIPALVRGVNYSANLSHSCPVTMLAAKLTQLIRRSDDPQVLRFIRGDVGAGVKSDKYNNLLARVKTETSLRQAELTRRAKLAEKSLPPSSGEARPPAPPPEK